MENRVKWAYVPFGRRQRSVRGPYRWRINSLNGDLQFEGFEIYSTDKLNKADIEKVLQGLLEKLEEAGDSFTLQAIAIDLHIAVSLWRERVLNKEILEAGSNKPDGIHVRLELLGEPRQVLITYRTYWDDFEFLVTRLPGEVLRVRDQPIGKALLDYEKILFA